ncbi:MAG: MBL fold metallo-hydrolase [Thermoanaerobaculia bacterium]|nr:MBL fold metallo-hydrolase [Thermoanaerobaculia bacterium]
MSEPTGARMPTPGVVEELSPRIRRITQDNPSVFTGVGTNTHLVGTGVLFILDPGPDDEAHFRAIVGAVGEAAVAAVIPTHHHADHWPLAPRLASHFDAPTLGFGEEGDYRPDRLVEDGEELAAGDVVLRAVHTPGHAPDHLCYLLECERTLFSGDHVMGWSTSVIAPPGGNLNQFLASLDKLEALDYDRMVPAHGLPVDRPYERIREIREHRQERTRQALAAVGEGLETIPEMVLSIYADVDPKLHTPAGWSLLAHLQALAEDGRVAMEGEAAEPMALRWRLTG